MLFILKFLETLCNFFCKIKQIYLNNFEVSEPYCWYLTNLELNLYFNSFQEKLLVFYPFILTIKIKQN